MKLYFAYGSNMDAAQMRERCPDARLLGPAVLSDYLLAFTIYSPKRKCGCADVIRMPGERVNGLLYELCDEELKRMDEYEGHPVHYRRISVPVLFNGTEMNAATYEVVRKQDSLSTSNEYLDLLRSAAKRHDFPREYQNFLANFAPHEPS